MDPGSWTDHGTVIRSYTGDPYNAIDPNFTVDEKGKPILSFGKSPIDSTKEDDRD